MEYKTLDQICDIVSGGTPSRSHSEYWNGNIPWVKISDITSKFVTETEESITQDGLENSSAKMLKKGTILYTIFATLGTVGILNIDACTNQAIAGLTIKDPSVTMDYLYYYLKSTKNIVARIGRGVAQNNINLSILKKFSIPIPDIAEQEKIVNSLEQTECIIQKRRTQIEDMDILIKSRFVEMFGDPIDNPHDFPVMNIQNIISGKVSNGFFAKRDEYKKNGNVGIIGVANVVNRMYSGIDNLPRTDASDNDIRKFEVKYGDLLFCRSSLVATGIGKASIVPNNVPTNTLFECHVIKIPLDLSLCVPEYVQVLTTTDFYRNQILNRAKTATMTTIGQNDILKTDILLPPIKLQNQFADFVHQVDKSKLAIQKSLDETQLLFDSLMQEYFG